MKALIQKTSVGIIFLFTTFGLFWGGCTHAPGVYFDNNPVISTTCSTDTVYFQNDILPLLNSTCATNGCHNATTAKHDVILTDYNSVMNTGGINLQNPAESKIYNVLLKNGEDRMPPTPAQSWTNSQAAKLLTWISQGAINNACSGGSCDTTSVTFNANVKPIFETNCYGCHSSTNPSGNLDLTNFDQLSIIIDNGALLGSIRHDAGYSPMPKGTAKLTACEINTIAIWVRDTTLTGGGNSGGNTITCDPDTVYFQNSVLPLISSGCAVSGCHDATTRKHGVQLTDYTSIMQTGGVSAGNPNASKLFTVLSAGGGDKDDDIMPPYPRAPFTTDQKNLVKTWILQGAKNNFCDSGCDTTNVTFSGNVFPIVETYCLNCHNGTSPGGGIYLRNYNDLVVVANNGKLMGSIRHDQGYSPMPKNGNKLSDCQIATFNIWIKNGTPNN